jgi:hypothetical protein
LKVDNVRGNKVKVFLISEHLDSNILFPLKFTVAGHLWLTPAILLTQEAEIRRIEVKASLGKWLCENLSQKKPSQK